MRSLYKKEFPGSVTKKNKEEVSAAFEKEYETKEQQKNVIIQALSARELEEMLRKSTKNVAHEVVSCLVESMSRGVLTDIIRWLTTSQQNMLNDHLSILDSSDLVSKVRRDEEEPEDSEDLESMYNTKSSMNTSGIRIKVRKSSVDPHAKKKSRTKTSLPISSKLGKATVNNSKLNEDIEIETENVRAGSPLNYVRDKKRKMKGKDEGSKSSLIVMQPVKKE